MKVEYKVVLFSVLLGAVVWLTDAVIDYLYFFRGTFWQSLVTMVAPHDAYMRVLVMIVFPVFGFFIGTIVARLRRTEEALEETEQALREIIDFNQTLLDAIPFGMEIVNAQGDILYMNKHMRAYAGDEEASRKCWQIIKDDKSVCSECPVSRGIDTAGDGMCFELDKILGGRKSRVTPINISYNGKKAILAIFQDIVPCQRIVDRTRE
ncbi:MAG: hypothetical protein ABH883_06065 [Candidatus Omnitrophota bacterium]